MRYGICLAIMVGALAAPVGAAPVDRLLISEVFYDPTGSDGGREWVELFNGSPHGVDLSGWSLGWAGSGYGRAGIDLSGQLAAGSYYLVGGPRSDAGNGAPAFDLAVDLAPDLQNSGALADAVALFDVATTAVGPESVPRFAVVYGGENRNGLLGADGGVGQPDIGDAPSGSSLELTASGLWQFQPAPTPGRGPLSAEAALTRVPVPGTALLLAIGALGLAAGRAARSRAQIAM